MKRIFPALCALLLLTACGPDLPPEDSERPQIVATVFPAYDFARSAAGELADVTLLLPPGAESHSYEPTPADILRVQRCDLFIYLGGESDAWVDTILSAIEPQGDVLRMIDCVDLLEEETVEGMQGGHDHEEGHDHLGEVLSMDEHVWTAPRNAAAVTRIIGQRLALLDRSNGEAYAAGAEAYALELEELDRDFAAFFDTLPDRTIVFGDRFPLLYFAEAYDLDYYAAFPGCGAQTEPSAATVAFLTRKVREEGLPAVWYIEFSNHLVADSIAEAAGVETAQFHTCHNVSRADLEAGATCLSLMRANLEALREHM
ncbi:metal ABC transporter substrate-binding protein [Oscillibacter sp.]|uniref:metal ABC transporter substrate-binding protein n=1 Tax=Oscillibacter sp. TaxID=1945593 RepID=UPI0021747EC7|nr:metal ABC transporter substrate-binding protein [Oscillibacter sp.]MCI8841196.1 zinc ABC transporter substrate-binding protein [Oscillibacter sp.]MCI9113083.1 zinc ABC transporter substrate-binding protein [Oscillibacter sp.]MCI9460832.1 zinc ABC transporter substrate-binding protein [Oscillibacter sp.]